MQTLNYDHDFSSSESEEDYINMEVQDSSFSAMFGHSNQEFEFQSFSSSSEKDQQTTTSPADELFYMGKLLPLHLPPRLEMVQKIFQHNNSDTKTQLLEEPFATPVENTPFQSCNVSPSDSSHVSGELDPHEYFLECSVSLTKVKKSWAKKLRWANLKSLFTKSGGCADNSRNDAANQWPIPTAQKHSYSINTNDGVKPFGQIKYNKVSSFEKDEHRGSSGLAHRRSFSGAFKMESKSKKTCAGSNVFRRSNTLVSSEIENPIQAAIAHCKRSLDQQQYLILLKKEY